MHKVARRVGYRPDPLDRTEVYHALHGATLPPSLHATLQRKVVVFVRGYMAHLYRALGGRYFDEHAKRCSRLGMRVLDPDVGSCSTYRSNSARLYQQLLLNTTPEH